MTAKEKLAKAVRVLTTPPAFAFVLCTVVYLRLGGAYAAPWRYLTAVLCLTVLPLLSYPIAVFVPALRKKGRETERGLAIAFSVAGYVIGFLIANLGGTGFERVLFDSYLLSGVILAVCTKLHFKASGHTCGCSGPIAALGMFVAPWFFLGYILLTPVVWSSLKLKRHTAAQCVVGAVIPVACILFFRALVL